MPNLDQNPQSGVGGTSYIYDMGTSPNTRVAVSQKSRVLTPHYGSTQAMHQMGMLGTFSANQSKTIENYRGIGFGDVIGELVPNVTEPTTLSFERALLYLSNLWQALGYASGVDGPVRSLAHHRWPFDVEHQLVFSTMVDQDLGVANIGKSGTSGSFDGGVKAISYPQVTNDSARGDYVSEGAPGANRGHSALITIYEACWLSSWSTSYGKDTAVVVESGEATVSDVHDFASVYGEFLATGNDPTIGQLGSIRFADQNIRPIAAAGGGIGGGGAQSLFVRQTT